MDLQGRLTEGGLPNLLQYLALQAATGCLVLRQYQGSKSYIFFNEGQVEHIGLGVPGQSGVRIDAEALSVLLNLGEGRYQFQKGIKAPVVSLKMSLERLILDASRRMDEALSNGRFLVHEDSVISAKPVKPELDNLTLSVAALQLLGYLNRVDSLRDIAFKKNIALQHIVSAAEELLFYDLVELSSDNVHPAFIHDLTHMLVDVMGPVGGFMVEDALVHLNVSEQNVPRHIVDELLEELKAQMKQEGSKQWFERETRKLCVRHGVAA